MDVAKLTMDQRLMLANVSASHMQDAKRAEISYTQHTATALRRRTLANGNGHS